jgi:hypothetical protein
MTKHGHKRAWYSVPGTIGNGQEVQAIFFLKIIEIARDNVLWLEQNKVVGKHGRNIFSSWKNGLLDALGIVDRGDDAFVLGLNFFDTQS